MLTGVAVMATLALTACAQAEPDEQQVARVVGALPGVTSVDASFTGRSLGGGGDQSIEVEVATPPEAQQVEDLVQGLPKAVREVEHGDGYDQFIIVTKPPSGIDGATGQMVRLEFGTEPVASGLATRWAGAVHANPPGTLQVRSHPAPTPPTVSLSSRHSVSEQLTWALGTDLAGLDWTLATYTTPGTPYVRFAPGRPLDRSMVTQWQAIEASYAAGTGARSHADSATVEDVDGVRRLSLSVTFADVAGPLGEAEQGKAVWPIVEAIDAATPAGFRLDLRLFRREDGSRVRDADLVTNGTGAPDWEAAYRQRFPDAVAPSAPPT